jgi:hypothetical protein
MEVKKSFSSKSPEYVKAYNQKYYEKLKASRAEKKCYCDICYTELACGGLAKHQRSKRHIRMMEGLNSVSNATDN